MSNPPAQAPHGRSLAIHMDPADPVGQAVPSPLERRRSSRGVAMLWLLVCGGLAGLSLLAPFAPGFDAWSWLIWGRELTDPDLALDTSGGPSWKPLTAIVAAPLTLAGAAAPELWLLLIRTAWLLAAVLSGVIAVRLTPRGALERVPGGALSVAAVSAAGMLLLDDRFTPWLRQAATGLSEPLLVALALGAFLARLDGRGGLTLLAVWGCALLRPEAWVILAWLAFERRRTARSLLIPLLLLSSVAALWFLPDVLGSGSPLTGAERAREGSGFPPVEALEVGGRLLLMPLALLWVGAFVAIRARWLSSAAVRELTVLSAVWAGQVAVLAALGYAGLPRFMTPVAAAVCILGAAGLAIAYGGLRESARARSLAPLLAVFLALGAGQLTVRAVDLVGDVRGASERASREGRILAASGQLSSAGEPCLPLYVGDYLHGPAVAWDLRLSQSEVRPINRSAAIPSGTVITEDSDPPPPGVLAGGSPIAAAAGWSVIGFGCESG